MKTFNTKLIVPFILVLLLSGCMPDGLTKFKKDEPKRAIAAAIPSIPNGSGGTVSLPDLVNPTTFSYADTENDLTFSVDSPDAYSITGDNSFATTATRESIIQSCSITPSLPIDFTFNTSTCAISSTPKQVYTSPLTIISDQGKVPYTVTVSYLNNTNSISSMSTPIKVQVLRKPTALSYTHSSKVILKTVGDLSTFSASNGNLISSDLKIASDTTKNSVFAQVQTVDLSNDLLGVNIINSYNYLNISTLFTDANTDYIIDSDPANSKHYFKIGNSVDSNSTYYQSRAKISEIRSIFPTFTSAPTNVPSLRPIDNLSAGFNLSESTSLRNYVEFTISPQLPTNFSIDKYTGVISGYSLVPLPLATYQVTASNALGSTSYDVSIEVIEAPTNLAVTRRQLLSVSTIAYSFMKEGDYIVTPIVSLTPSVHGIITKKVTGDQIEVLALDGSFAKDDLIDLGKTYNAMLSSVLATPVNFNAAITTAGDVAVPAVGVAVGNMYAHALVDDVLGSRVYVSGTGAASMLSGSAFLTSTIVEIDAESLKLTMSTDPADVTGLDAIGDNATTMASGYVYQDTGADVYLSNIFRSVNLSDVNSRIFRDGDNITFGERYGTGVSAAIGGAGSVAFDHYLAAERGVYSQYKLSQVKGTGISYSVSPALPTGMSLDTATGVLSGTPTARSLNTSYVLTAKNLLGTSTVTIKFEVRDYFTLSETSDAPSFRLHKVGDFQNNTACRVNSSDIINSTGNRDIRCFMDGEEQDIHSFGMKLKSSVGPGICKFVAMTPYHFWQWSPKQTTATVLRYTNSGGTIPSDREITTEKDCEGNYTLEGGPNCDEGTLTVHNYTWDLADGVKFADTEEIQCGGKATNCLGGAISSILDDNLIETGVRGLITAAAAGFDKTWEFTSPISQGHKTNLYIANNSYVDATTKGSKCSMTTADVDLNIELNYTNLSTFNLILDTTAMYTAGTDTLFYGSSRYNNGSGVRGRFSTGNQAKVPAPYKIVEVYSKLGPFNGALPYYHISCLDAARESKASIIVNVREWNKTFNLQSEIDKEAPDDILALPLMRASDASILNPINDYADWNDNFSQSGSPYNRRANNPIYPACGTAPSPILPTLKAQVPTMVYPAADEFQFPEGGL